MTTPIEPNKSKTIPLHIADQAVAACEAEIQKLREENARLKQKSACQAEGLDAYDKKLRKAEAEVERMTIERNGFEQAMKANQSILETKRDEIARLKAALTNCKSTPDQFKAKPKRIAKRKPTAKATPKTGWRKMSTAPLGTPIEVRLNTNEARFTNCTVTATLDEYGFWIGKVYWARFTTFGHDRLDDWRPLSK